MPSNTSLLPGRPGQRQPDRLSSQAGPQIHRFTRGVMGLVTCWGQLTGACSGRHIRSSVEWGWGEADWAPSPWISELLERSRSLQGQDTKSGWV